MKLTSDEVEKIKQDTCNLVFSLTPYEMLYVIGTVKHQMIKSSGKDVEKYFVCPISSKVLAKKSSKKIITSVKEYKNHTSTSWYYVSVKAFNFLKNYKDK